MQIRRGKISRNEGIKLVKKHEGFLPQTYLDKPLEEILGHIDMNLREFEKICDKFTNKNLFKTNNKGQLIKDKNGSLIKNYNIL